jgi:hypothetical protein
MHLPSRFTETCHKNYSSAYNFSKNLSPYEYFAKILLITLKLFELELTSIVN